MFKLLNVPSHSAAKTEEAEFPRTLTLFATRINNEKSRETIENDGWLGLIDVLPINILTARCRALLNTFQHPIF